MVPTTRAPTTTTGFSGLGLADLLLKAVAALGYEEPTPIQSATIPLLLSGRDLLAQAATGTGKTAAFALPLIHQLMEAPAERPAGKKGGSGVRTRGLVLVPTRELAMQVAEATHKYARGTPICVVPLYGGASISQQIRALERGCDIVVATPGRALDHIRRGSLNLASIKLLVLDEADEMLDMGFAEDIDAILSSTPETRQTALFSATMPPRLRSIAEKHLRDPQRINIAGEKPAAGKLPRIRQVAYVVARGQKPAALQRVLDMESPSSAIVFCRTRLEVDSLVETLNSHGYRAEALHGGMEQRQRDAVMGRFRAAKADLLIATDVAARGLDIQQLSHVFNYDVPAAPDAYVHRIGRTGRAGREGTAITLADPREHRLLRSIERVTKQKIEVAAVPSVADVRGKRLEQTKASLREQLAAGGLDDVRVVVESLAQEFDVLDVAARGLDIQQLSHVFNYDVPAAPDAYVHRIGRTGRAGREGTAITLADPREHRLLRSIERVTKQKIEVAAVPSVADVRGKRLEQTKASLREQLAAGGLDDVRVVVESLAQEFDVLDVAAAAVKLAHAALTGDAEEAADEKGAVPLLTEKGVRPLFQGRDPNARLVAGSRPAPSEGARGGRGARPERAGRAGDGGEALARLYFAAGRSSGIRPGDLVGAITNEAGLSSKDVGAIQITDRFSLVDVPEALADDVVNAMRKTTLRGQKVQVRRDREK